MNKMFFDVVSSDAIEQTSDILLAAQRKAEEEETVTKVARFQSLFWTFFCEGFFMRSFFFDFVVFFL